MSNIVANYDLEFDRAIEAIKKNEAKRVLLHMPDGIKPKADQIIEYIQKEVGDDVELLVWGQSCFGACDLPIEAKNVGVDLLIHWGHSRWKF